MIDYREIYRNQAERYDHLVTREDYQGHLLPTLEKIRPLRNTRVVELGAGTGRLTSLMVPLAKEVLAVDNSAQMLAVALSRLEGGPRGAAYHLVVADNGHLPAPGGLADVVIAGWTLGHLVGWYPADWPQKSGQVIAEMERVTQPNGTQIIIETLGTGRETPEPPTEGLAKYYRILENTFDFTRTWIRTDYRFETMAEANSLTSFFFGQEMIERIRKDRDSIILPECTGIWWRTL